jgi:hypothetical protein
LTIATSFTVDVNAAYKPPKYGEKEVRAERRTV